MMNWQAELITAGFWLFKAFFWVMLGLLGCIYLLKRTNFGQKFWLIVHPCLNLSQISKVFLMIGLLVFFVLIEVKISVLNTKFYNQLYSSLQDNKAEVFWFFAFLNALLVIFKVIQEIIDTLIGQTFEIRWLEKLNHVLLERWLYQKNYYRLHYQNHTPDNIDQRIEQDAREFITTSVELVRGVINAVVSVVEFTIILWGLSGILVLFGLGIPKGVVFFIYLFIIVATLISVWIGKPLINLNFNKEKLHGDYRYSLIRVQDNAESIAFYDGEQQEKKHLSERFSAIIINRWAIVRQMLGLDGFNTGVTQTAMLLPLMLQAPRFFAGQIKLGDMHQTVQSFNRLMRALSFFRLFYEEFTLYQARIDRLHGFLFRLDGLDNNIVFKPEQADALVLENFMIVCDGKGLSEPINLQLNQGDRLLIQGTSGTGKTTLLKAMAGICPFTVEGTLKTPGGKILFVPQRAYMPQGALKQAICYPSIQAKDDELKSLMRQCYLDKWINELDKIQDWQTLLSPGELQRVAFLRVLLERPDVLFLDEATSALDEPIEQALYCLIVKQLPRAIIVSVGHRSTLHIHHNKQLILTKLTL